MIVTVDLEEDLLACVAAHWTQLFEARPSAVAAGYIFLPTRRAATRLSQLLGAASPAGAGLLPHILSLDQISEATVLTLAGANPETPLPAFQDLLQTLGQLRPPLSEVRRKLLLARLIFGWAEAQSAPPQKASPSAPAAEAGSLPPIDLIEATQRLLPIADMGLSLRLAETLLGFLDELETEGIPLEALSTLAPEAFAEHWQEMLAFLNILLQNWPEILKEERAMDPLERQRLILTALGEFWAAAAPPFPVLVVGSTGTRPAVARLMAALAPQPEAWVVLPGLDVGMDEATWDALEPTHPQFTMMQLLKRLSLKRAEVACWRAQSDAALMGRRLLLEDVFRPAPRGDAPIPGPQDISAAALKGVRFVACSGASEEAGVAALAIREGLERGLSRIALVTPDRTLARTVVAALTRWGIIADDSAGVSLGVTPEGMLAALTMGLWDQARLSATTLLSILKNPGMGTTQNPEVHAALVGQLETAILRRDGFSMRVQSAASLLEAVTADLGERKKVDPDRWAALEEWWGEVSHILRPLFPEEGAVSAYVDAHQNLLMRLLGPAWPAWRETPPGACVCHLLDEVRRLDDIMPPMTPRDYEVILGHLLDGAVVRISTGYDERVHILGPLEARLLTYDLVVVTGLNEGVWPRFPSGDPWMSRDMRTRIDLPLPERRMGLAAHDFMQVSLSPEVVWTRAQRIAGTPAVPSRWLTRLDIVLQRLGLTFPRDEGLRALWRAQSAIAPRGTGSPPTPCPPTARRPRQLSVTQIEMLRRNPYAVYARSILRLRPLEQLDQPLSVAAFGTWLHGRLEALGAQFERGILKGAALERWIAQEWETFGVPLKDEGVRLFWRTRYERAMHWAAAMLEALPRDQLLTELPAAYEIVAPGGRFRLTAVMDRVDVLPGGATHIIDYKTGAVPTHLDVASGYSPQLPLEGVMLRAAGYDVSHLAFWRILPQGMGEVVPLPSVAALIQSAEEGLKTLIAAYDDPDMPYLYAPFPTKAPSYEAYALLARAAEWA